MLPLPTQTGSSFLPGPSQGKHFFFSSQFLFLFTLSTLSPPTSPHFTEEFFLENLLPSLATKMTTTLLLSCLTGPNCRRSHPLPFARGLKVW